MNPVDIMWAAAIYLTMASVVALVAFPMARREYADPEAVAVMAGLLWPVTVFTAAVMAPFLFLTWLIRTVHR